MAANRWAPYKLYGTVDLIYSRERWDSGDRFCEAQSVCNLVEIALQLLALRLWLGNNQQHHPAAALVALIAQVWGCFRCGCWRSGAAQEASSAHGGN
jgi:hypothetical protein